MIRWGLVVNGKPTNGALVLFAKNAGGGNYFDELLARIRDIRSSEKVFYRKILEIYATSIDYDPRVETTQRFFQTVQNKMHFSAHGHTAAELIYERADAEKDFMGLTTWTGILPKRTSDSCWKNLRRSCQEKGRFRARKVPIKGSLLTFSG